MLPFPLVYSPGYDLNLGEHVFPCVKYRMIHDRLLEEGIAGIDDFVEPDPITCDDAALAHTREWIDKLRNGKLTINEVLQLEIPYSSKMINAAWLSAGGSVQAARDALRYKFGFNVGGGFHHAFPDHGEGFCAINDIAIAVRKLQADKQIAKAMVVDLDVHHGNGTAAVFAQDSSVFTLSLHQQNVYPAEKPPSSLDVGLDDNTLDRDYLAKLRDALDEAFRRFQPDLVLYVAGADPYMEDQLGGLLLTIGGLRERDRMVYQTAIVHKVPITTMLAGGYAARTADTVTIHINTIRMAADAAHALPI